MATKNTITVVKNPTPANRSMNAAVYASKNPTQANRKMNVCEHVKGRTKY
jgi:hypothetical protein